MLRSKIHANNDKMEPTGYSVHELFSLGASLVVEASEIQPLHINACT